MFHSKDFEVWGFLQYERETDAGVGGREEEQKQTNKKIPERNKTPKQTNLSPKNQHSFPPHVGFFFASINRKI